MSAENEQNSYEDDDNSEASQLVRACLPHTNNVVRGQKDAYAVGRQISAGRYGAVYEFLRRPDGKRFGAKLEICQVNSNALNMDYVVLRAATKAKFNDHFADLIDRGKIEGHFKFLVIKLLGENLNKLRMQFEGYRFSAPTALKLALKMLSALEQLHSLGFIHRDIKPSNFCIYEEDQHTKIYLIDFGLCRQFRSHTNGELKAPREHTQFRGTPRYASLAAHRAEELSRKDDLESWLYVVIEFMIGELPWSVFRPTEKESIQKMKENSRTTNGLLHLLTHCPRVEFVAIMKYLDSLTYYSQPDYNKLRQFINEAAKNNDIPIEQPYDWQIVE